jgi:hypothetical protein
LRCAFSRSDYTPRNITVGDYTDWFQVVDAFNDRNLTAVRASPLSPLLPARHAPGYSNQTGDDDVFAFQVMAERCSPFFYNLGFSTVFEP